MLQIVIKIQANSKRERKVTKKGDAVHPLIISAVPRRSVTPRSIPGPIWGLNWQYWRGIYWLR